ncbi:MAG: hypothetical protein GX594_10880 [Pirellulaceae bacterium]|nr:hypothetical protein [Pirellulaceae bacterium]
MSRLDKTSPEFESLLAAACREDAAIEELQELERMANDSASMRLLVDYMQLDADLQWLIRRQSNVDKCLASLGIEAASGTPLRVEGEEADGMDFAADPGLPAMASDDISLGDDLGSRAKPPALPRPSLAGAWQATADLFYVGGPVFSYTVALVFMCLLLLGFWMHKISPNRSWYLADGTNSTGDRLSSDYNSRGLTDPGESSNDRPAPVFVGRVTGMAAAKWSDEPN